MMRVLAISAALVSGEIDWTTNTPNIYTIFSAGDGLAALNTAAGADDDACAAEAAAFLNTDTTNAAKSTPEIVCDAADEAATATLISDNIAATLDSVYAKSACTSNAAAKTIFSNAAAKVLFADKATICAASSSTAASMIAAMVALAIRLL